MSCPNLCVGFKHSMPLTDEPFDLLAEPLGHRSETEHGHRDDGLFEEMRNIALFFITYFRFLLYYLCFNSAPDHVGTSLLRCSAIFGQVREI